MVALLGAAGLRAARSTLGRPLSRAASGAVRAAAGRARARVRTQESRLRRDSTIGTSPSETVYDRYYSRSSTCLECCLHAVLGIWKLKLNRPRGGPLGPCSARACYFRWRPPCMLEANPRSQQTKHAETASPEKREDAASGARGRHVHSQQRLRRWPRVPIRHHRCTPCAHSHEHPMRTCVPPAYRRHRLYIARRWPQMPGRARALEEALASTSKSRARRAAAAAAAQAETSPVAMATAADADLLDADEQREDVACNASPTMSDSVGCYLWSLHTRHVT